MDRILRIVFAIGTGLVLGLVLPAEAHSATLRLHSVVEREVVSLGDLWDGLSPRAAGVVLGNAPEPGSSFTVESQQLAHIARLNGLDWRPQANERITVERPGQVVPRALVEQALMAAVARQGGPRDALIELGGWSQPMMPAGGEPRIDIDQLSYDRGEGRFVALVSASAGEGERTLLRITGKAIGMIEVVVATRRIAAQEPIGRADVRIERIRSDRAPEDAAQTVSEVVGRVAPRPIGTGQPVQLDQLGRAAAVAKGASVTMAVSVGGLEVAASGRALEDGRVGDTIPVQNLMSRAVVDALVVAPGSVRVAPGSLPRPAETGRGNPNSRR